MTPEERAASVLASVNVADAQADATVVYAAADCTTAELAAAIAAAVREAVAAERERCLSHLVNAITDWLAAPDLLTLADVRRLMGRAEDRIREGGTT
jgi:hypothetical protein